VRVSAKADYALRACVELAAADAGTPVKGERIAQAQEIPLKFLENILGDLRHAGLVRSQRGAEGGYWLARPASEVTLADVIRAVDGPLATSPTAERRSRCRTSGSPSGRACARCSRP
jgi:Rrf2 family protein